LNSEADGPLVRRYRIPIERPKDLFSVQCCLKQFVGYKVKGKGGV